MTGLTPDITAVSPVRHGVLRLVFADGLTGEIEVLCIRISRAALTFREAPRWPLAEDQAPPERS
jgi:hypothetical protein